MEKQKLREDAQEEMRKITSLSKQAILLTHRERFSDAKSQMGKAKELMASITEQAKVNPVLIYGGMLSDALQEYAEANVFIKLIEESQFASPKEIDVPPVDYVLGLADVVGEYRRVALDALRKGDVRKGEKCLEIMDEIFMELLALDEAYMLVPGLRRKCDVARKIIEATRGDITQEVRRQSLEDNLRRFENRVKRLTRVKSKNA